MDPLSITASIIAVLQWSYEGFLYHYPRSHVDPHPFTAYCQSERSRVKADLFSAGRKACLIRQIHFVRLSPLDVPLLQSNVALEIVV